jgi:hypothetical protein
LCDFAFNVVISDYKTAAEKGFADRYDAVVY